MSEPPTDFTDEAIQGAAILSFIVRVWREESPSEKRQAKWRGHITTVPQGKRRYFKSITEIPDLIAAHLSLQK